MTNCWLQQQLIHYIVNSINLKYRREEVSRVSTLKVNNLLNYLIDHVLIEGNIRTHFAMLPVFCTVLLLSYTVTEVNLTILVICRCWNQRCWEQGGTVGAKAPPLSEKSILSPADFAFCFIPPIVDKHLKLSFSGCTLHSPDLFVVLECT